jgi:hypothetical protein
VENFHQRRAIHTPRVLRPKHNLEHDSGKRDSPTFIFIVPIFPAR